MESQEDDYALNIDSLLEDDDYLDSDNEYNIEPIPVYFLYNTPIEFGFFEQSSNSFYSIEKIEKACFRIKQSIKILEVSFRIDKILQRYFYHLTENFPTLIKNENTNDIFLHFKKPPKFSKEKEFEEPSDFVMKYLNEENNLICLDCPYRTIFIPNCPQKILNQIYSQIFFIERREISIDKYKYLELSDYLKKINELKNQIDLIIYYIKYNKFLSKNKK